MGKGARRTSPFLTHALYCDLFLQCHWGLDTPPSFSASLFQASRAGGGWEKGCWTGMPGQKGTLGALLIGR